MLSIGVSIMAEQDDPLYLNGDAWLTPERKVECEKLILSGDKSVAAAIYSYYETFEPRYNPFKWQLLGMKLNDPVSSHNLTALSEKYIENKVRIMAMPKNAFCIPADEVELSKNKVFSGSANDAFWLFLHYRFSENNINEAEKWRKIAEKRGIVLAKEAYWNDPQDGPDKWQGLTIWENLDKIPEKGQGKGHVLSSAPPPVKQ